jgi:hypothetical protein
MVRRLPGEENLAGLDVNLVKHARQDPAISWTTNRGEIGFSSVVSTRDNSALWSEETLVLIVVAGMSDVGTGIDLEDIVWHTNVEDLLVSLVKNRHASVAVAIGGEGIAEPILSVCCLDSLECTAPLPISQHILSR